MTGPAQRQTNGADRRRALTDAAITVLADGGLKGLSHLKVDRRSGLADGTTSVYYRTRAALLEAIARRVVELDLSALRAAVETASDPDATAPSLLAQAVARAGTEPHLTRAKARFELNLEATRNNDLARVLAPGQLEFVRLHQQVVAQLLASSSIGDAAIIQEVSIVTRTFLGGLLMRYVYGDLTITDPHDIDNKLAAIAQGIIAANAPTTR